METLRIKFTDLGNNGDDFVSTIATVWLPTAKLPVPTTVFETLGKVGGEWVEGGRCFSIEQALEDHASVLAQCRKAAQPTAADIF